jgi:hypothetical protein
MMKEAPVEKTIVVVRGKEISLDPDNMKFSDSTLSIYMDREYTWIDYFGKQLEFANEDCLNAEAEYDAIYSDKYVKSKDIGNTENYAKAQALSDVDVIAARKKLNDCKKTVGLLKAHLKAWDKNHSNAQSRGHTLRQEMKALNQNVIYGSNDVLPGRVEETCNAEDFLK